MRFDPYNENEVERDWWDRIEDLSWQHIVLLVAGLAAIVVLAFVPPAGCSLSIDSNNSETPTTTTPTTTILG